MPHHGSTRAISVSGSSGAGTTSVKRTFEQIFRRERIPAALIAEKCAEAGALRRAFPEEIGNALTAEEMDGQHRVRPPSKSIH